MVKEILVTKRREMLRGMRRRGGRNMDRYKCKVCGYVYSPEEGDPDNGVAPGTAFGQLPDGWTCPVCGAGKDEFEKEA
jgi:rubredoxin